EKQHVLAGQTVAKMGNTGANRVMLHFEIRYHGQSVNPLTYLPKQ
ncbi:MAG: peptidoglycan DD-metalloendopeptidase family protein, partial [Shewanella sp.]